MRFARCSRFSTALGALALLASAAAAESGVRVRLPRAFGVIPAASYDAQGNRIGEARLVVERLQSGNVRIFARSGFENGARTVASAELAPIDGEPALRLVAQESRSFLGDGTPLGILRIDHRAGVGRCHRPDGDETAVRELSLPEVDRVVNVPMNLFFEPLWRGEAERLSFQMFLCRGNPRLLDFEAYVARRQNGSSPPLIEVRYGPEFGRIVSLVAQSFVPRLSFWFDPTQRDPWIAHRLPLYSDGPEITVVRDGVPLELLGEE